MDHLPYPQDAAQDPLKVPYLCGRIFSSHELCKAESGDDPKIPTFSEFIKWGNGMDGALLFDRTQYQGEELLSIAQAFCYFGLLAELLDAEFTLAEFLIDETDNNGVCTTFVTTRSLNDKIHRIRQKRTEYRTALEEISGDEFPLEKYGYLSNSHLKTRRLLSQAMGIMQWLTVNIEDKPAQEKIHIIRLSLEVLCWSLLKCLPLTSALLVSFRGLEYDGQLSYASPTLIKRLTNVGWCRYMVSRYIGPNSAALMYYMSGMAQKGHDKCTETECVAKKVDRDKYQTQHAVEHCNCPLRGPDLAKVKEIIQAGGIPILRLSRKTGWWLPAMWNMVNGTSWAENQKRMLQSPADDIEMEVVEAAPGMSYIAMSHVWADGLGNPRDNKIHACQLRYLLDKLQSCPPVDYTPDRLRHSADHHRFQWEEELLPSASWFGSSLKFNGGAYDGI